MSIAVYAGKIAADPQQNEAVPNSVTQGRGARTQEMRSSEQISTMDVGGESSLRFQT